jgi:hypothetical protein
MGIALSDSLDRRSNAASLAYTAIALVFFFGIGLAGGTAYKLLIADDDSGSQPAQVAAAQPPSLPPVPQIAAATPEPADAFAPSLAHLTPTAPPALTPPPAPSPTTPTIAAAPPAASVAPAPVPSAEAAPTTPAPAEATSAPRAHAAPPRALAQHRAPPPKKPRMIAKATRTAPAQTVALHAPPTAPANASGPFRVQFGAFANEDNARRVQWAVEATGLKVQVTAAPGSSGQMLYYLRSPVFADYASALSAAQTVRDRVQHFVNAIPIDYAILGDHASDHTAVEQQAQR